MIYKEFQGKKLSALGLGAMRLPVIDGDDANIDVVAVEKMVEYAMQKGINYYDTAWGYHRGQSELVMGKVLEKYPRESFYLASKFPGYDLSNMGKVEEIFEKQLQKCGVDYFDFYLFHNVCESNIDGYLNPAYGIFEYLMKQKENGRIKHLGFSAHASMQTMERFLSAYGSAMEFCQLQINWLDWEFQSAKAKVELVRSYGIPVWVMEPLRGGKLVHTPLGSTFEGRRPLEVAFRFLQGIEGVGVTLSGMSNFEQLAENIEIYQTDEPLSKEQENELFALGRSMTNALPCTGCKYCMEKCPMGLNIPYLIELYNEDKFSNGGFMAPMALSRLPEDKKPSACLGCRACEDVCPQNIKISEALADFTERLKR